MTFPGPGAQVYYNEVGEPLGWDYPSYEPPEPSEEDEWRADAAAEAEYERAITQHEQDHEEAEFPETCEFCRGEQP